MHSYFRNRGTVAGMWLQKGTAEICHLLWALDDLRLVARSQSHRHRGSAPYGSGTGHAVPYNDMSIPLPRGDNHEQVNPRQAQPQPNSKDTERPAYGCWVECGSLLETPGEDWFALGGSQQNGDA